MSRRHRRDETQRSSEPAAVPFRVAVVGGGPAGLAAVHRFLAIGRIRDRPIEPVLFETSDRCGGLVATERIDGYLAERGADSFITNKPGAVALCRELGLEDRLIPTDQRYRRSLVLFRGRPVEVPEGFLLLSPAKIGPVLRSPLFSWPGKLRMGLEPFVPRRPADVDDESLASFVRRRFGREALDRLVQPLVGGIYTSDPEKLSLRATLPRFLDMEREHGSLLRAARREARTRPAAESQASGARYGLFATPRNGLQELLDALIARATEGAIVRLQTGVTAVRPSATEPGRWTLVLDDVAEETFDAAILAVPAWRAAEVLAGCDPGLAELLAGIEYASSAIVLSGHRLSDVAHPLDAFGLVVPRIERRRVLAVSFASRKFPGRAPEGRVLLRTFVGGALQPELLERSDAEIESLVREELADILGVRGEPDFVRVQRWMRSMPQYHLGHVERTEAIAARTGAHPGLALAGSAYEGVGLPDSLASGDRAARTVAEGLAKR